MKWDQLLALLNWQGLKISFDDFKHLKTYQDHIKSEKDFISIIENLKIKSYLLENKDWIKKASYFNDLCQKNAIQLTWPGKKDYPKNLELYHNSPTLLSYKGRPIWNQGFQLCIVGSRKADPLTLSWMDHHLGSFLSKHPICVLSGGARGVDQKAHALAIRSQIPTLCFLPCGLLDIYPSSLLEWIPFITEQGAVVSPFPPTLTIRRSFFEYRNSIMARMSHLVFVMQAEIRSGSAMTARLASLFGVTACTLPGPVMNPLFRGNLNLINDGILMIRDHQDLETLYYAQTATNLT